MSVTRATEVLPMLIGGEHRAAVGGETIEARSPATGELLATFPRAGREDMGLAVDAAAEAFPGWRATDLAERAEIVRGLADTVDEHAEELARLDVADNGSPLREMRKDARTAAGWLRYFAALSTQLRGQTIDTGFDRLDYTLLEPFGVVGRIIPFNHPVMFAAAKIAAPLVAGNTVVLKPSEWTSLSALRLAELLGDRLPPGVLNVVTGYGGEAGDALVRHPAVRRLAFIGSVANGRRIQERAAQSGVKTVSLELGGKNPIVVMPDADLELAVDGALRGMNFTWQGQSCGSTSRLLVHSSLHDNFVGRLADRISALRSGTPDSEDTDIGALVHRGQWDKVIGYIRLGREEGARVVVGGGPDDHVEPTGGLFVRPTLFDGVTAGMRLAQEEIFGPVLAVMRFETYDEARAIANGVSYGLTASIFTSDLSVAHRFARDVEAGFVWVNDSSRHFQGAPFGGVKDSGVGREEGVEELASYTQLKNVNVKLA